MIKRFAFLAAILLTATVAVGQTTVATGTVTNPAGTAQASCAWTATLVNPFGWGVWRTVYALSGDPVTGMVTEWQPIWRHSIGQNLGFLFIVALVGILGALFPKRICWPSLMASAPIALLGILHVRFTGDAPLPAIPKRKGTSGPCRVVLESGCLA